MDNAGQWLATLAQHRNSGIAIDTNLLLLLWIGNFDRTQIGRFKRLQKYVRSDFDLLLDLVSHCPKLVTTPNIMTQVSDLAGQLPGELAEEFREEFRRVVEKLIERYYESAAVAKPDAFLRFGLADGTLLELARQEVLILTDDLPLYIQLANENLPAINFTYVRASVYNWPKG